MKITNDINKDLNRFAVDGQVFLSIDAEWCKNPYLSVQVAVSDKQGKILQYYLFLKNALPFDFTSYQDKPVHVVIYPIGTKAVIDYFDDVPSTIHCYFYYSPRDIEGFLGPDEWTRLLVGSKVDKTRNLKIKPYPLPDKAIRVHTTRGRTKQIIPKVYFTDLYGRFGSSLEEAYNLVNIDTTDGKDYISKLNIDKAHMDEFFTKHPREFLEYSLGDLKLHLLALRLMDLMNEVLEECFGIVNMYRNLYDYPGSIGSMVNDIFIRFLHENYPDVLRSSCYFSMTGNDKRAVALAKSMDDLARGRNGYQVTHSLMNKDGVVHGLGACSIPAFFPGNYGCNDTSAYGAVVQGGRAIKEDQERNKFTNVLDIDLSSAYGSSLKRFDYPFGLPTIVSAPNHLTTRITLREFLDKYGHDLEPKLFVIYVEGDLKHKQDLVFSKYKLSTSAINAKLLIEDYEEEDSFGGRIGGDFLLTSKQLELGILTSDTLDILKKVCTSKEWQDWLNLGVTLAVFYPKSLELSLDEWASKHNSLAAVGNKTPREDNRSRYWCRFPLESFIGPLIAMRKFYKSKREEHPSFESKQLLLKLIINTLYGDLASPHFPAGNTVLANNITSSVRNGSWMMSKALGCKFVVTDGGIYEFDSIPNFKTHLSSFRKPGLQTLFTKSRWKEFVSYIPLSQDIPNLKDFILADKDGAAIHLDALATEVINNFCAIYGLEFPFSIEHKINNSAALCVTNPYGKVDYILYTFWDEEFIRIRGVKKQEYSIHPKVEALRAIAEDRPARFHGAELIHIIGVNEYIKNPNRFNKELPGHEQPVECIHKPNREGSYIYEDYATYHKAQDAHRKRIAAYDKKYKNVELILKPSFL